MTVVLSVFSQDNLNRMPAECPLVFTEPKPAHQALRDQIFGASAEEREAKRRAVALAPHIGFLSPETPATCIEEGRRIGGITVGHDSNKSNDEKVKEDCHNLNSDFTDETVLS